MKENNISDMFQFYYLVNTSNKTLFCLGRDNRAWYDLSTSKTDLSNIEILASFLFEEVYKKEVVFPTAQEVLHQYLTELAQSIASFVKNATPEQLHVIIDSADDLTCCKYLGYRVIDTRAFDLEFLNRHLLSKSPYHKTTKQEELLTLLQANPEFKKYVSKSRKLKL